MADLKKPLINSVIITGNLTRDPMYRKTSTGFSVVNLSLAMNRCYRYSLNKWQEEVCYVGVVAWNKLAESCGSRLKKGSAVLVDGELQSHVFKTDEGFNRNVVEIKARRVQFLNKRSAAAEIAQPGMQNQHHDEEPSTVEDDSFDRFLASEESHALKNHLSIQSQGT